MLSSFTCILHTTLLTKKLLENTKSLNLNSCLEGFEPPTFWFVAKHSIQLSYRHLYLFLFYDITKILNINNIFFINIDFLSFLFVMIK